MPPKGWRKDSGGNYPNTSYVKEQEKISIDDLLFPKSLIMSLAKESIHSAFQNGDEERRVTVSKDAALAMQRSATVFVNHLLTFAQMNAKKNNRKSCNEHDIMMALDTLGFGALKSILVEKMEGYQKAMQWKKQNKQNKNDANGDIIMDEDEDEDEDEEEEEEEGTEEAVSGQDKGQAAEDETDVEPKKRKTDQ